MLSEEQCARDEESALNVLRIAYSHVCDFDAIKSLTRRIPILLSEITRLKAEIERLKGEDKYAGEFYSPDEAVENHYRIVSWVSFKAPHGEQRHDAGVTVNELKRHIDSGVMKRVSKAETPTDKT